MKYMEIEPVHMEITIWIKDPSLQECSTKRYYAYEGGRFRSPEEILIHVMRLAELHQVGLIRVLDSTGVGSYAYDWLNRRKAETESLINVERYLCRSL